MVSHTQVKQLGNLSPAALANLRASIRSAAMQKTAVPLPERKARDPDPLSQEIISKDSTHKVFNKCKFELLMTFDSI